MSARPPPRRSQRIANKFNKIYPPTISDGPTILRLPPELRLLIYEFTLMGDGKTAMDPTAKISGLLATNPQLRNEAQAIWYGKNCFLFLISDCNAKLVANFIRNTKWTALHGKHGRMNFVLQGKPNWGNLVIWCRLVHEKASTGVKAAELGELARPLYTVIAAAHEICRTSRRRKEQWDVCLKALESLRKVAVLADCRWLED